MSRAGPRARCAVATLEGADAALVRCTGDQGGPLILSRGSDEEKEDLLVGIATSAKSIQAATCSQFGVPGMYTDIQRVAPFVDIFIDGL